MATGKVDPELGAVFLNDRFRGDFCRSIGISRKTFVLVRHRCRSQNTVFCPGQDFQLADNRFGSLVHPQRKALGHQHIAKSIDNQARQSIRLGMNQSIRLRDIV